MLSFLPPLLSPSCSKSKRLSKTCAKKTPNPNTVCDNNSTATSTTLSEKEDLNSNSLNTGKIKPGGGEELTEEVEKEINRLFTLSDSGFSMANSNTVTLLHLSLLLGGASEIRLEYEWKEKPKPTFQPAPAFCAVSNQVTNVLRRLCHIAALELAGFQIDNKTMKGANKPEWTGAEGSNKKDELSKAMMGRNKKKEGVRSVATMTDLRMTIPAKAIPITPANLIHHHHHHADKKIGSTATIQLNGRDSVFRVPLVPTFRPVLSKEQEQKLRMQQEEAKVKLEIQQEQAKAIMREAPRSRLLKRRSIPSRKGKQPSIIVQRTLMPKPGGHPVVVSMSPSIQPTLPPSLGQTPNTSVLDSTMLNGSTNHTWTGTTQPSVVSVLPAGTNILELAAKSAQIGLSPTKDDSMSGMSDLLGGESSSLSSSSSSFSPHIPSPSLTTQTVVTMTKDFNQSSISNHADISISDFDVSLASASTSGVGPDAGDKFLDSVLERSRSQGFSGLITPVSSSNDNSLLHPATIHVDTMSLSVFNIKTSPQTSPSPSPSPSTNTSPNKLTTLSNQSWMAGESADVSLSSFLGEFSSFQGGQAPAPPQLKTPIKRSMSNTVLFDQSSSDAVDNMVSVATPPKPAFVSDMSMSLLLGDPSLSSPATHIKQEDGGLHQMDDGGDKLTPLLAPSHALFSEASQDSLAKLDVDVTLQGMVNESSLDLVTKFEKLAAQMAEHRQQDQTPHPDSTRLSSERLPTSSRTT